MKIIEVQHQIAKSLTHVAMKGVHFFLNYFNRMHKYLKFYVVIEVSIPHHYLTKCDMM